MNIVFWIVAIALSLAAIFYLEAWLDHASQVQRDKAQKFQGTNK